MRKENILAVKFPELAKEWHPTKNGELTPMDVTYGLPLKVWWFCTKGHEWESSLNNRSGGKGCPYCAGVKVSPEASLQKTNPELSKEWHLTKNKKLLPIDVLPYSDKRVWWKCEKGHEWQTQVKARSKGTRCPYCMNKRVNKENNLSVSHPELAHEWHKEKNGKLTPIDVVPGSNKKVWWKCNKGHEYQAPIVRRVKTNSGCPYCVNALVCEDNSLAVMKPALAKEWHPIKNGKLTPFDVVPGYNKKVWWKCEKGHEWQAVVNSRSGGNHQCPFCTNQKVYSGNCLANVNPELAKEWHPTKNGKLKPELVTSGSTKVVWWQCKHNKNHVWQASVGGRNSKGSGCRLCSVQTSFPEQAIFHYVNRIFEDAETRRKIGEFELDIYLPELNLGIEYDGYHHSLEKAIERDARKDAFFKEKGVPLIRIRSAECPPYQSEHAFIINETLKNGKSLEETVQLLFNELKIRTSDDRLKKLIEEVDINLDRDRAEIYSNMRKTKLENSFAAKKPHLIEEWHPVKNGELTPYEIAPFSLRKYWWVCKEGHEFEQRANDRNRGQKCPYCVGQKATEETNLLHLHPKIASEWHPTKNVGREPRNVTASSNRKAWWICAKGHEYESIIANRTTKGVGCPYCSNRKVCADNSLQTVHPELAKEWHPTKNGNLTPNDVVYGSNKRIWWMCKEKHEWITSINNRSHGTNCPHCRTKKE